MKIFLSILVLGLFLVPSVEAKTVIKTSTTGNAKVSVSSNVVASSSNVVTKNCSVSIVKSSNGGGIVEVSGVKCECK